MLTVPVSMWIDNNGEFSGVIVSIVLQYNSNVRDLNVLWSFLCGVILVHFLFQVVNSG